MRNAKRYTIVVMPQSNGKVRKFSVSHFSLIVGLCLSVFISLVAACSIIWGTWINQKNDSLWSEYQSLNLNYYKQKKELERVAAEIERARKREKMIRDVLGIDGSPNSSGFGQGGTGYDLRSSELKADTKGKNKTKPVQSFRSPLSSSSLDLLKEDSLSDKATLLNSNLDQLLSQIERKKLELAKTPSIRPVLTSDYWYSDGFGLRRHPMTGTWQFHPAIDISAKLGTPIAAAADGKVVSMSYDQLLGLNVRIRHDSVYSTLYAHLLSFNPSVKIGSQVQRSQVIGYLGNSGRTTGPHLHYEVWVNNKPENPLRYIFN